MTLERWRKLLGKHHDDRAVKAALAAAGVKQPPKLPRGDVSVIVDLAGHGMWLKLVDVKRTSLMLTSVGAYVQRRKKPDLYTGKLPYKLVPGMTRAEVQDQLGPPHKAADYDCWLRDGVELVAGYGNDGKLGHICFELGDRARRQ